MRSSAATIRAIGRIPRVGRPLESLIKAVRMYSRKPVVLILSSLMTVGVHCLFAVGCYLIACGLPGNHLSLAEHFVVMPLSAATQVIPAADGPVRVRCSIISTRTCPWRGRPSPPAKGWSWRWSTG